MLYVSFVCVDLHCLQVAGFLEAARPKALPKLSGNLLTRAGDQQSICVMVPMVRQSLKALPYYKRDSFFGTRDFWHLMSCYFGKKLNLCVSILYVNDVQVCFG